MAVDPARDLTDPGVVARSLVGALPYWTVVNEALLLADGSYEFGFVADLPHLATMSDAELEILQRRLMRLVEAVPAGERLRFTYTRCPAPLSIVKDFADVGAHGNMASQFLHRRRVTRLREEIKGGQVADRQLLITVTYHPPRTKPSKQWLGAVLLGAVTTLFTALATNWMAGLIAGGALGYGVIWLSGVRRKEPMTPLSAEEIAQDRDALRTLRARVLSALESADLEPRPLSPEEYLHWAWRHFNPGRFAAGIRPPALPKQLPADLPRRFLNARRGWLGRGEWMVPSTFRDSVVTGGLVRDPRSLQLDGCTVQVLSMDTLPVGDTVMNLLGQLLVGAFPMTIVVDLVRDPRGAALRRLMLRQRLLRSVAISDMGSDDPSALRGMEKTSQTQYRVAGGETDIVRIGCATVIAAPTPEIARDRVEEIVAWFANEMQDVRVVQEDAALARTFFALAPFSGQVMPRTRAAETENGVHALPLAGSPKCSDRPVMVLGNRYQGLTYLDPFDPRLQAYNAVLAGPSGSGKTVFGLGLALHAYAAGARVVVIDRGSNSPAGPWLTATRTLGGQFVPFDAAAQIAINPCDLPPGSLEPDENKLGFLTTLISRMTTEHGEALSREEWNVAQASVRQAYARHLREENHPDGSRTVLQPVYLRDIVQTMRNLGAVAGTHDVSDEDRVLAGRMATRMYQWVDRGRYASLLDRPTTVDLSSDWILFDTSPLANDPHLLPVAILLVTDLVWRHVSADVGKRPTLIVLDEVWSLLADQIAGDFIQNLYRRLRTTGSAALSISQDMADFRDNAHALGILTNAHTYYLSQAADPAFVGKQLHLNHRQVNQLGSLGMVKGRYGEVLVVQRLGARQTAFIARYRPTPEDRWISESDATTRLTRERYMHEYGDPIAAIQALARDIPYGMPRAPVQPVPRREAEKQTTSREGPR